MFWNGRYFSDFYIELCERNNFFNGCFWYGDNIGSSSKSFFIYKKKSAIKKYNSFYTIYKYLYIGGNYMRLKASFTVENSVIISIFTIIIVSIVLLCISVHASVQNNYNQFRKDMELQENKNDNQEDMIRLIHAVSKQRSGLN